ncbi:HNH endonuclease [Microbacterium aerolatum]|uniref:HNH endonuclease signature motif containing protein n=1 Tax=Microbacterium aerolatum TaxID=153731 RepID=UPI00200183BA|nr:HNH endonuclease signature motif containing protein [Microbacterium aerolatum]MCK3770720.1 HNH endonuclease [Microbacterium aerolatum]
MNSIVARLRDLEEILDSAVSDAFGSEQIPGMTDTDVAELLAVTGRVQRRIEGLQVEATVQVDDRSGGLKEDRMTTRYGCSRPADLVRMLTGSDTRAASRLVKAARLVRRDSGITDGAFLPAQYQALREVMVDGDLGLAGLLAATDPIEQSARRISDEDRVEADRQLADFARGIDHAASGDETPGPAPLPEDLGTLARVMVAYLDPDGAEPADEAAMRGRYFLIGMVKDGAAPVRGSILPEVAEQLTLLMDSLLNPKVNDADESDQEAGSTGAGVRFEPSDETDSEAPAFADTRTRGQKLHDALAAIVNTAARTDLFPHLGGAAPTLVIAATAADLVAGHGWASTGRNGDLVSITTALQTACAGGIQRILFDEQGRIASIGTSSRIFNALQRRAITIRDGGCVIPGCTVPPTWCEVHHVREHADGGPTHTDNGVLLCWFHHRTLHLTEWVIRMNHGIPEVRGPAWWDPHQHWHRARSPYKRQPVPG